MRKSAKLTLISITMVVCTTGCRPNLQYESFSDKIGTAQELDDCTIATGEKGIYCIQGVYKKLGLTLQEGMFASASGRKYFNIKQLVAKYPSLNTDKVKLAIIRQSKLIQQFEKALMQR